MESIESLGARPFQWVRPNLRNERGEIERVIENFLGQEPSHENFITLYGTLDAAPVVELSEEDWERLENTDSYRKITPGRLDEAEQLTEKYNEELEVDKKRDFKTLLTAFKSGEDMECPVVVRKDDRLHLVSGNTRLMISRGLRLRPQVLIGDIT